MKQLLAIALLLASFIGKAQKKKDTAVHDFKQREIVLFEDDFGEDTLMRLPLKWHLMASGSDSFWLIAKRLCHIEKDSVGKFIKVTNNSRPQLEYDPEYSLGDYFTIEIEFLIESPGSNIIAMLRRKAPDDSDTQWISGALDGKGKFGCYASYKEKNLRVEKKMTIPDFDRSAWHRLAISFQKQQTRFYVDDSPVSTLTGFDIPPSRFFIVPKGLAKIRHIRVATGDEVPPIEKLMFDKKFTTHSILFDVNKSVFRHTSMAFITRLAVFLKKNASVKLEIDGHTDGDGNAAANMKLSLDRANAVKKQLIKMGIAYGRLRTKGCGASKPIDTNTTIQGKANNRRVEFIKE